jgi:hypothetical protein
MKKLKLAGIIVGMFLIAFAILSISWDKTEKALAGGNGFDAYSCTASSSTIIIGDDIATTVLSAHSRRAWATLQVNNNATNTVATSFGGTASMNNGYLLNQAITNGASTTPSINFGLNTDFPYTGAISAITNFSTTTILVTQCIYNR